MNTTTKRADELEDKDIIMEGTIPLPLQKVEKRPDGTVMIHYLQGIVPIAPQLCLPQAPVTVLRR